MQAQPERLSSDALLFARRIPSMSRKSGCIRRSKLVSLSAMGCTYAFCFADENEVHFIDVLSFFDTNVFMCYFCNLTYQFVRSIQEGKDCKVWGKSLCSYFDNIIKIYDRREELCNQLNTYLNVIYIGLEKKGITNADFTIVFEKERECIQKKGAAASIQEVIFSEDSGACSDADFYEQAFKKIICSLTEYLDRYIRCNLIEGKEVKNIFDEINRFISKSKVDLTSVHPLEELQDASEAAWKENAGVIVKYMKTVGNQCGVIEWKSDH